MGDEETTALAAIALTAGAKFEAAWDIAAEIARSELTGRPAAAQAYRRGQAESGSSAALKRRVSVAASVVRHYGSNPQRAHELVDLVRARNVGPLERREPWWPFTAIASVRALLPKQADVFEFGGGGSTLWLTDMGATVTVAEHEQDWVDVLREQLPSGATVLSAPPTPTGSILSTDFNDRYFDDYVGLIDHVPDSSLDLVIVDGRARVACAERAKPKIRSGGVLLFDDTHRSRYSALTTLMDGWERRDYRGVKFGGGGIAQTSTWTKP